LRLRGRLAIQLALLAVCVTAATSLTALVVARVSLERRLQDELGRLQERVGQLVERDGEELSLDLERVERRLRSERPELLEQVLRGEPAAAGAAGRLLAGSRLELLEVLDGEGRVVSSTLWQARAGLRDLEALNLSTATVQVIALQGPAEVRPGPGAPGLALARRRELSVGDRVLSLVAAFRLDRRFLNQLGPDVAVLLVSPAIDSPVATAQGSRLDRRTVESWLKDAATDGAGRLTGDDESTWLVGRVVLSDAPGVRAEVVVAVDRGPLNALLATMTRAFLLLGIFAALVAGLAGTWIAGRITRPVARLVRQVDAIAAGQADYTFDRSEQHELDELVTAFSRLYRRLERQQKRSMAAERVAAWRDVARRVAHDVKNPLAPIRLTLQNLRRARREAPERFDELFHEGTETILEEVERLSRMVGEFSEFARLPLPRRQPADLEALIDGVADLYAAQPDLTVECDLAGNLPQLPLDTDQISRALNNVLTNAVEAMRQSDNAPSTMRLTIRTVAEDDAVRVEVADNGPGLAPESSRRIFEPYFTTKPSGTGLGMAITYRIVAEHGGTIEAGPGPVGGAVISIRLPLVPEVRAEVADRRGEE
jgi:signal transduction histidine kinase